MMKKIKIKLSCELVCVGIKRKQFLNENVKHMQWMNIKTENKNLEKQKKTE